MGIDEVIGGLSSAEQLHSRLLAAAKDAEEMEALAGAALSGSQAGPLLNMIRQVKESILQAGVQVPPTRQRIGETIQRAHALGN
jgi:hypothetical protein